jgi:phosphoglycolate phosphatase-like HAD superfamily hydrolase
LDEFNPYAQIFLDDIEEAEWELSIKTCSRVNLKKPNPFPLLKAAEIFGQRAYVLYVGDSMEDALMVRKANELDNRFFFAGVYNYSSLKDAVLQTFLESRCDIILPSVNELPFLFQTLRGEG